MSYMEVIFLLLINVGGKGPFLSRFSMGRGDLSKDAKQESKIEA